MTCNSYLSIVWSSISVCVPIRSLCVLCILQFLWLSAIWWGESEFQRKEDHFKFVRQSSLIQLSAMAEDRLDPIYECFDSGNWPTSATFRNHSVPLNCISDVHYKSIILNLKGDHKTAVKLCLKPDIAAWPITRALLAYSYACLRKHTEAMAIAHSVMEVTEQLLLHPNNQSDVQMPLTTISWLENLFRFPQILCYCRSRKSHVERQHTNIAVHLQNSTVQ